MSAARPVAVRLRVDPVACDAYGFCAALLPERISLDEWGYPVVDGTPVDAHLLALATRAVTECPRRALSLERSMADDQPHTVAAGGRPPPPR